MSIFMDKTSIKYFNGITFMYCGEHPHHKFVENDRYFPDYYGLQYNHAGNMNYARNDSFNVKVNGPYAFITHPNAKFHYGSPEGETRHHLFVSFKGPKVKQFIRQGLMEVNSPQPLVKIWNSEQFYRTFTELISILQAPIRNYPRAVLLLEELLLQLQQQSFNIARETNHLGPKLRQLEIAIQQNPNLEWDFQKEADTMGISYPHFRRIFRENNGTSPLNYLIKWRLKEAASLLLDSEDQISTIAEKCGMPDKFYFSRLFKKYYSLSPLNFRKEFKNHNISSKL